MSDVRELLASVELRCWRPGPGCAETPVWLAVHPDDALAALPTCTDHADQLARLGCDLHEIAAVRRDPSRRLRHHVADVESSLDKLTEIRSSR